MPPHFFPAILVNVETEEEFLANSPDDIPDNVAVKVKEYSIKSFLCRCNLTDRYQVVHKGKTCESCDEGALIELTPLSVRDMLKDINDQIDTMQSFLDKWRPKE